MKIASILKLAFVAQLRYLMTQLIKERDFENDANLMKRFQFQSMNYQNHTTT